MKLNATNVLNMEGEIMKLKKPWQVYLIAIFGICLFQNFINLEILEGLNIVKHNQYSQYQLPVFILLIFITIKFVQLDRCEIYLFAVMYGLVGLIYTILIFFVIRAGNLLFTLHSGKVMLHPRIILASFSTLICVMVLSYILRPTLLRRLANIKDEILKSKEENKLADKLLN